MPIDFDNVSHRRWNPLTQAWVLCSPHRAKRPWLGQVEKVSESKRPQHDPKCYLCPRNARVGGHLNPDYTSTFTFPNDFPAVQAPTTEDAVVFKPNNDDNNAAQDELFMAEATRGECHVICFHPGHHLTTAEMTADQIRPVIEAWTQIYRVMQSKSFIDYCQIFENKGDSMGCSNPHPHGQVWGTEQVPEEPRKEIQGLMEYRRKHPNQCLLCDYAQAEIVKKQRIVCQNDSFICLVPWWAVWPFETMILAREHLPSLLEFTEQHCRDLADIIRRLTCRYDNLFECSFPYSMGLHQAPCFGPDPLTEEQRLQVEISHFHMHYYPPLLRSATVKKFQTGFEMLATPQRDITSEQAAERLRNLPEIHYKLSKAE